MNDQALKWIKAAPLPALVLGAYVYAYAVDQTATSAAKDAAVAAEGKRDQSRRLEKIDEKLDKLLEAVVQVKAELDVQKVEKTAKEKKK